MNFRYRLMQFMSGRYGTDETFFVLFTIAVILSVANIFIRFISVRLYTVIQLIIYALIIFALFRMFSRNTEKRRKENYWVKEKLSFLKRKKDFHNQKKADIMHVYKKCPACKAVLRLPRRVGVHTTVCPKCGKEFTVRVKK
ncbi:MAG: zf-TFIIB domain-containing protein [Acutalibacteraceae bacterium]|nr:zf-TFIIB domain-containing protein [Acutalibacteraceae bacterium]